MLLNRALGDVLTLVPEENEKGIQIRREGQ